MTPTVCHGDERLAIPAYDGASPAVTTSIQSITSNASRKLANLDGLDTPGRIYTFPYKG
jgi:hypothetical protein